MRTLQTSARSHTAFRQTRLVCALLITLVLLGSFRTPFAASATSAPVESTVVLDPTGAPFLQGTFQVVNNEPGNQVSVHVDCDIATYTYNGLITKLQTALVAIDAGDTATACSSISAFINVCRAQSGKKLTPDQSTQLINSANHIKTDLGCP